MSVVCARCGLEMAPGVACTLTRYDDFLDGKSRDRLPYVISWWMGDGDCNDCGAPPGGPHHPGCDIEECPKCHTQAIGCDCRHAPA